MGFSKKFEPQQSPQSPSTKDKGNWGEQIAADFLVAKGFSICELQWRSHNYEIDIIAQRGNRIVFVEVKTRRSSAPDPVDAVDRRKRQRMISAADSYLKSLKIPLDYEFDIISIIGTPTDYTIEYIPDAFMPTTRGRRLFGC